VNPAIVLAEQNKKFNFGCKMISFTCNMLTSRAGLKPMQPIQLHCRLVTREDEDPLENFAPWKNVLDII